MLRRLKAAVVVALSAGLCLAAAIGLERLGAGPAAAFVKLLKGLGGMLLAVGLIQAVGAVLFEAALPALGLSVPALIFDLIRAAAYFFAALAVLSELGVNLTGLVATSAVVTAIVAFSLQDTLGNLMGGLMLNLERWPKPGDWVRVGTEEGIVREIRWRQTTIETFAGSTIVMPNSVLMKTAVTVVGRRPGRPRMMRRNVPFRVYYDRPPTEITAAVESALLSDPPPNCATEPPPRCFLMDFEERAAVYQARYWLTDLDADVSTDSAVRTRIYYALARQGVKLSVPLRSIVVNQADADVAERSREREHDRRVAALRGVDIFAPLSDKEVATLAARLTRAPFARGESLTRQGAREDWLYVLESGEAEIRLVSHDRASSQAVARLEAGDFVGEMSLMTGEPRAATAVALTDVSCYRLDRDAFTDVIATRPEIAEAISAVLAKRRTALEAAREGLDDETRARREARARQDLLSRIRGFFTLGS